jgi:hypothetical protein
MPPPNEPANPHMHHQSPTHDFTAHHRHQCYHRDITTIQSGPDPSLLAVLIVPALSTAEPLATNIRVARLLAAADVATIRVEPAPEALRAVSQ